MNYRDFMAVMNGKANKDDLDNFSKIKSNKIDTEKQYMAIDGLHR